MRAAGWKGGYCWEKTGEWEYNKIARLKGARINSDNLSWPIMDKLLSSKLLQNPSGCKTKPKCGSGYIRAGLEDLLLPFPNQLNHTHKYVVLEAKTQYVYWLNQQSGEKALSSRGWGWLAGWLCSKLTFLSLPQAGATVVSNWNDTDWIWGVWKHRSGVTENHQGRTPGGVCLYNREGKVKTQQPNLKKRSTAFF